ncbi:MAG: hypothetical protein RLZZ450_4364 [Pseudomonadota bacterium]|jgi:hypothetical protein
MKLYKAGDKSKALCPQCEQLRRTTFAERDVPFSSGTGLVSDVLVGVCDTCDTVVSIPQQSVPRIKDVVRQARRSVEVRVPRQLLDALGLACHELGFGADSSPVVFRYYLKRIAGRSKLRARLASLAASEEAAGHASARFSAKLNDSMYALLQDIEQSGITQSDLVKAMLVLIKQDVLDEKRADVRRDLQSVMQIAV